MSKLEKDVVVEGTAAAIETRTRALRLPLPLRVDILATVEYSIAYE